MAEWSNALDLKSSDVKASVGSNPTLSVLVELQRYLNDLAVGVGNKLSKPTFLLILIAAKYSQIEVVFTFLIPLCFYSHNGSLTEKFSLHTQNCNLPNLNLVLRQFQIKLGGGVHQ